MRSTAARNGSTAFLSLLILAACGGGGGGYGGSNGGGNTTPTPPAPTSFTVGGTVTGLASSGLVLLNNGGDALSVSSSGAFTFATSIATGSAYSITVGTQPNIGPLQVCTVTNGGGSVASAAVTSVAVSCVTKVFKFLYIANPASNTVNGFTINASTGELAAIAGSPFLAETGPRSVTGEPSGKYVYVASSGDFTTPPQISGFSLNGTTGVLTELPNSPYPFSSTNPPPPNTPAFNLPVLHPSGLFGYLSIPTPSATLYGAALDTSTGDLAEIPGFPMPYGFDGQTPVIDPTGKYLFQASDASAGASGRISSYQITSPSGVLTPNGAPVPTGGNNPFAMLTPDGKFLIVANSTSGTIAVMAVDSAGTLSMVGSPIPTGGPPGTVPFRFMYERRLSVFYFGLAPASPPGPSPPPPSVAAFSFNATTGALTPLPGSPYSSNGATVFPWLHPSGKFLYQSNSSNGTLQRYLIDQTTGVPTLAADVTTPADMPFFLIPDPSGRYVYVTSIVGQKVSSYSVDQTTGALTVVNTLPTGPGAYFPQPVGLQ
jgi:6-phosphogluconolactonase (cycloisomerase 2 family)